MKTSNFIVKNVTTEEERSKGVIRFHTKTKPQDKRKIGRRIRKMRRVMGGFLKLGQTTPFTPKKLAGIIKHSLLNP